MLVLDVGRKSGMLAVPCVGLGLLCRLVARGRVGFCGLKLFVPLLRDSQVCKSLVATELEGGGGSVLAFRLHQEAVGLLRSNSIRLKDLILTKLGTGGGDRCSQILNVVASEAGHCV